MFQIKVLQKIKTKTHFVFSNFFSENHASYEVKVEKI
jgi:hypothetical protein